MAKNWTKRCPVYNWKDEKIVLNELKFIPSLSKNLSDTMFATYLCSGDDMHQGHLIRIEDSFRKETFWKSFSMPKDMRKRLFPRNEGEWQLRCPLAKAQMTFDKRKTAKIGDETVDIFRCAGTGRGHFIHYAKLQHGMIPFGEKEMGVLIFTREVNKKRVRNDQKRLTKGEYLNLVNKVWKEEDKLFQPKTIFELITKKL